VTLEGQDGSRLDGIAFRATETPLGDFLLSSRGTSIHVAGSVSADLWQGQRRVQLRVTDAAKAL
jgi:single-stranded-DNA-specific exonuclease